VKAAREHWSRLLEIAPRDSSAMRNWKRTVVGPGTGAKAEVVADAGADADAKDEIERARAIGGVLLVGVGDFARGEGDGSPRPKILKLSFLGLVVLGFGGFGGLDWML
jgi:hypothetical protein